ncbi:dynamin-related protein 4C-like protein [Tanacetum coccineum]
MSREENIILNVLSATADITACEPIRMSRLVENIGQRTIVVVTKYDQSSDRLLEKLAANDVNVGLSYVCVRNRINDET